MDWITKRMMEVENALKEVETSNLTNETKMTVLRSLKEELSSLNMTKIKIENDEHFVKHGFGK